MASTKRIVEAGSTHAGVLELGSSGESVQVADAAYFKSDPIEAITAAGSAQGDATALVEGHVNVVGGADGTKGVVLPTAVARKRCTVYNTHASNGLKVYPAADDDIDDGTTDAAITIEGKTSVEFIAIDGVTWISKSGYTANT